MMSPSQTTPFSGRLTDTRSLSPIIEERAGRDVLGEPPDMVNDVVNWEATPSAASAAGGGHPAVMDLYRSIVESANQGIWVIDAQQRTTFINGKLAEALGYRPDEVVGRPAWDLVFPEDHAEGDQRWAERKKGETGQSEFRLRRKDGTEVWFHASTSPLLDAEGRFAGASGFFADITERRRADEALRQSERQARQLADSMPHIVWTARADGSIEYFNGRWYEYTGMLPGTSLDQPGWRSAVHPDDLGRLLEVRDPAVEAGHVFQADIRLRDREGSYRWHMVRSVPVCDESGRVVRRFGTATDIDDRMRAEEAMRAGEQRFRFLAESIPQMVWTATPDGLVDYVTPRSLEFLGVSSDHVLGWAWMDLLHPDDRQRTVETWQHSVREGTEFRIEYQFRDGATGAYRWFLAQALSQRDDAGRVLRWYGTCTDIDAQWRARQEIDRLNRDLRARVDELETLFETVPIGIAIAKDVACASMRSNPAFERILEIAPASNISQSAPGEERPVNFRTYRDGREVPPEELPMQVAARTGQPVTGYEEEVRFADGRTKRLYGNASPLFDEDGTPRGAVGAFLDMTEWRRVEAALKENEEQLRLAIRATDLGLFDRDIATNILRWSDRCKAIFGLPPEASISIEEFYARVHPEDRPRVRDAIVRAVDPSSDGIYDADYRCIWDDGTIRWAAGKGRTSFEEHDGHRRAVRIVGTVQDITARKDAEAQLKEAKEAAETASRAKDRFIAVLSHELRTPLSPVLTAVSLLEMTPGLTLEMQENLAMIRRNIRLETRLIDDLLDLSRVITGKLRLDRHPTHLNDLVRHVLDIVEGEVHEKGLVVETDLSARSDLVDVDPARLQQVVWNLVKNAAKFTSTGGTIRVATRQLGERAVEVEVRDTGKGMSTGALPYIFDPFEQGDPSITQQFGGLGLGLSIAKAVVDRHGGTIRATSDGPGLGSSFTVTLSLLDTSKEGRDDAGQPTDPDPAGRVRVLFVEDHADTGRAMAQLLERSGYEVHWADCVAAALRLAADRPFDVVVSDLGLPDGSGYELMQILKDRYGARGIALSGFGMEGDILRGRESGFLEHLVKPVDVATLDQAIRRIARLL
jgi:PAS domain S-box-containing protein